MKIFNQFKTNKKDAGSLVFIIFFITIFLAFLAIAIDGSLILTSRLELQNKTEMAAMTAAAEFNSSSSVSATTIQNTAKSTFNSLKANGLKYAKIKVSVNTNTKKVNIETSVIAEPFFLTFLGVNGVKLEAKACAVSEELPVTGKYTGINWINASAAYLSDILSQKENMNDTAITQPIGNLGKGSASYAKEGFPDFGLISSLDNKPLSLGPGGFITIKLPAPIVDKTGFDLYIKEFGSLEGYMVFAGLDNDPNNPYVNAKNRGGDISWVNITCSATSDPKDNGPDTIYSSSTDTLGAQDKFYGSAYFDIGASCSGNLSMAKYIRIIDDNSESAFVKTDEKYYKAMLYGEASTATAGADIDYVAVLNHVKLIKPEN